MKSLRDQQAERFREITGLAPIPFDDGWIEETEPAGYRRGGCGLFGLVVITIALATLMVATMMF